MNNPMDAEERSMNMNQQQVSMGAGYADDMQYAQRAEQGDLTKWQQDIQNQIDDFKHTLRGNLKNSDGEWYEPDEPNRIMNDIGIRAIDVLCKPLISVNNMMSNYKEEWILMKMRSHIINLIFHLRYNYKRYEIQKGNLDIILNSFKAIAEPTFFRAMNNGERAFLNTQNRRVETIHQNPPPQQQKGFMGLGN